MPTGFLLFERMNKLLQAGKLLTAVLLFICTFPAWFRVENVSASSLVMNGLRETCKEKLVKLIIKEVV